MDITSSAIVNGFIADKYGSKGTEFGPDGMPVLSFPLKIEGAPAGTASFAVVFDDPDAVPPCGFKWVHWLVAGLRRTELAEDSSRNDTDYVQGANSWYGHGIDEKDLASCYGGPSPPDKTHTYVITVTALDFVPVLRKGFSAADLKKVSEGHVLAKATLKAKYSPAQ
ncbi:MAG: YbhB/YbcL family Raf kinase inhibitor-like protein [archaeon]|nr:YbhB/YbcL family Raf kinase inhibitor-like protein [archaeon]